MNAAATSKSKTYRSGIYWGICSFDGSLLLDFYPNCSSIYTSDIWSFYGSRSSGGKKGTASVGLYLLLGVLGVPVFAGMTGGIGVLLGTTGGYIIGFFFSALVMWAMEKLPGKRPMDPGDFYDYRLVGLLYVWNSVVYDGIYEKSGGSRSYDCTGMVCDSFYYPGYIKNCSGIRIVKKVEKICFLRIKMKIPGLGLIMECVLLILKEKDIVKDFLLTWNICLKSWKKELL